MKRYLKVVEVALEFDSKFLMIQRPLGVHAGGLLAFPGGKVEAVDEQHNGDILRAAAKREVYEEVGLDIQDPLEYVLSSYFQDTHGVDVIDSIFYCRLNRTILEITPSKREVSEYSWMTAAEIMKEERTPPWLKQYMKAIQTKV